MRRLAALSATALLLAACGAPADSEVADSEDRGLELEDLEEDETDLGLPVESDAQGPDDCTTLSQAPDGRYLVGEAGVATVVREEDTLLVGEIEAAPGWEYEVVEDSDVQVRIQFLTDEVGEDMTFQVTLGNELEPDRPEVLAEICAEVAPE